jgi:hypothetical protein
MSTRTRARWTIVLSVLLVVTGITWVRSYAPDDLYIRPHQGRLLFMFVGPGPSTELAPKTTTNTYRSSTGDALAAARREATRVGGTLWDFAGFEVVNTKRNSGYFILAIPFWAIGLPLVALTAWCIVSLRRERLRRRTGRCLKCGYDLRASTGRCPECGEPIPAAGSARDEMTQIQPAIDIPPPSP